MAQMNRKLRGGGDFEKDSNILYIFGPKYPAGMKMAEFEPWIELLKYFDFL